MKVFAISEAGKRFQFSKKGRQRNIKPSNNFKTQFKDDEIQIIKIQKKISHTRKHRQINEIGYFSWPFVETNEDNFKYAKLAMMCEKRLLPYTHGRNGDWTKPFGISLAICQNLIDNLNFRI